MTDGSRPASLALCRLLAGGPVPEPLDWPALAAAAEAHDLAPALALALGPLGLVAPEPVAGALRLRLAASAGASLRLAWALPRILAALEEGDLPCVVLKGADLALRCYPDPAARPMVDLDLLVHPEDLEAATAALAALSYHPDRRPPLGGEGPRDRWEKHDALRGGDARWPPLELHWHLVQRPWSLRERLDLGWFWARREWALAQGLRLPRFSPEALLVHLCLHADGHGVDRHLKWLFDLHLLLAACPELDWEDVADAARRFDCGPAIGGVLVATRAWFGTEPPAAALAWADGARPLAERSVAALTRAEALPPGLGGLATGLTIPDRRGRWRAVWRELLPSPAYMRARYGLGRGGLLPLAYARRWARGAALAAGAAWRLARRR